MGLIRAALLSFLIGSFAIPSTVQAQGGIALGGTFSDQEFELPQGVSISSPSVYVIVFNHGTEEMNVRISSTAPFGIEVSFSNSEFLLSPDGEQKVYVTVKATDDAVPGEYEVTVSAQAVPKGGKGVTIATASAQKASLVITGESALIQARVVTPDGKPIKAQVRLFKVIEDRINEIASNETGLLEVRVSPGIYTVSAFIGSRKLAEQTENVSAGETKKITLKVKPIYFEFFGIEPNYAPNTEQLTFIRVVYTLSNLSQPMANGEVILQVSLEGKALEQVSLISLGRLDIGRTEGSYSYLPAKGWVDGNYSLKLQLYIEGEPYIDSSEEKVTVTLPKPSKLPFSIWWLAIGVAIIVAVVLATIEFRRRRKKLPEKRREEVAPLPPMVPTVVPAATRNLLIKSYDMKLKRGETCNARVSFEYQGPALTGTIRVAIGKIETFGFDEKAYVSKRVVVPETASWKSYFVNVSIPTGALRGGTYDLYAKAHEAFPETISPYLRNVIMVEEAVPPPPTAPTVPSAATRNLGIKSYDGKLKRGETCNVRVTFEYQGPALTGTIRVAIGEIGTSGFDEKAYVSKQVVAPETISWKSYFVNVSIPTGALGKGTYDLYARAYGAFPEIISPYLRNVITIEE